MTDSFFEIYKADTFDRLISKLFSFGSGSVFRGQRCKSWYRESSVDRLVKRDEDPTHFLKTIETTVRDVLKSKIHHYVHRDASPVSAFGWTALAQHHGAPTRLLDFTALPLVALYFAIRGAAQSDDGFAIWVANFRTLNSDCESHVSGATVDSDPDQFFDDVENFDTANFSGAWIGEPRKLNLRLERQGGTFLVTTNPLESVSKSLAHAVERTSRPLTKIEAPCSFLPEIRAYLKKAGVSASRLFDGVDGLAQEISEDLTNAIFDWRTNPMTLGQRT